MGGFACLSVEGFDDLPVGGFVDLPIGGFTGLENAGFTERAEAPGVMEAVLGGGGFVTFLDMGFVDHEDGAIVFPCEERYAKAQNH